MAQLPLFISYSRNDGVWMERVKKHLAPLVNERLIDIWVDVQDLRAGDHAEWDPVVLAELEKARMVVVLLSPDFAASPYCQEKELPLILEKKEARECKVYFLNVIPCVIDPRIAKWIVRPSDKVALSQSPDADGELKKIAQEIRTDIGKLGLPLAKRRALDNLEEAAKELAHPLLLEDADWMREARRLESFPPEQRYGFREIVRRLAGLGERAPVVLAAFLMLGAERAGGRLRDDVFDSIRDHALFGAVNREAQELVRKVKEQRVAYYLIRTDAEGEKAVEVTRFFWTGPSRRLDDWSEGQSLSAAGDLIADDVWNEGESTAAIRVMTGPDRILRPAEGVGVLDQDDFFRLVFVSATHVASRARGRLRLGYIKRLETANESIACGNWTVGWGLGENDPLGLTFPAVAPGSADDLDRLLKSHLPFAAVAQATGNGFDRSGLLNALAHRPPFAKIPETLKGKRAKGRGCILSHLSVVWDDRVSYSESYQ